MTIASQTEAAPAIVERAGSVVSSLVEAIEAIVGSAFFVDLTFPRASIVGNPGLETTRMLRLPRSRLETNFLQRFRQSGGHVPITTIDLDDEFTWPSQVLGESNSVVVTLEDVNAAIAAGKRLRSNEISLLCPAPLNGMQEFLKGHSNSQGYRRVHLTDCNAGPSYLLFLPHQGNERGGGPVGFVKSEDVIFSSENSNAVVEARSMIHDGGYVSEGDIKYSWLWTGPSTHFRLVLPQIAGVRPRLAELCVPRTEEGANLDRLAVQLDGRTIRHRLDRWSATSGKVSVDIPRSADYTVLTLVVPSPTHDANSGRLLGLCLDKLILTP